jgi:7-cyano-7-deazaguanine synthase
MSIVTLVSGGLDSTLMVVLAREAGVLQFPLFVDYGQRSLSRELSACQNSMGNNDIPQPTVVRLGGFGALSRSGLTDSNMHIMEDAFTPGRNMLFLLTGAAHAYRVGANAVAIGLLNEGASLFPDQTSSFLRHAQRLLSECMGRNISVLAPLMDFTKQDVVRLAREKKITGTYSCHMGTEVPCGVCISCREFQFKEG